MEADKHKVHHARQAGPKARKREAAVKKKKGTLDQSKADRKNVKVRGRSSPTSCGCVALRR
jgi:hypothetical protein